MDTMQERLELFSFVTEHIEKFYIPREDLDKFIDKKSLVMTGKLQDKKGNENITTQEVILKSDLYKFLYNKKTK
jgi:hypothetical protein